MVHTLPSPDMKRLATLTLLASLVHAAFAGDHFDDKFRQLDELLPTPTGTRTASGAPGHAYWQQRADYRIRAGPQLPRRDHGHQL